MLNHLAQLPVATYALVAGATAAIVSLLLTAIALRRALTARRSIRATQALLDVHMDDLAGRVETMADASERIAARSEVAAASAARLADSASDLHFLLESLQEERAGLDAVLAEAVLPDRDRLRRWLRSTSRRVERWWGGGF